VIRVLVVDDEPLARRRLTSLLAKEHDLEIVGEAGDGRSAIVAIREHRPDLVFLDVQMPEPDGFGVLRSIGPERMPVVVFVTAHDQYAVRAFEVHALDYLLKPFDRERFQQTLERARAQLRRGPKAAERVIDLLEGFDQAAARPERFVLKSGGRVQFLRAEEIDWAGAERNYVALHAGGRAHLLRQTLTALEAQLDPRRFVRIHRSTIANLDRVLEIQPSFQGEHVVVLKDGTRLSLSRRYRGRVETALGRRL
jgi:two-component system LytT family response regulator